MTRLLILSALLLSPVATASAADATVWWEGEAPAETNFPKSTWFSAETFPETRDRLSGGAWLTSDGERGEAPRFARYELDIPKAGRYRFWCRKFYTHGPFRWRFGSQRWRSCPTDVVLQDSVELKRFVCANWVYLGAVTLERGRVRFELELLAKRGEKATGCFDAFFLSADDLLIPSGGSPPKPPTAAPGPADWFPVAFYEDGLSADSVIDASHLNDSPAGRQGRVIARGAGLAFEATGAPARFWGCNASFRQGEAAALRQRARMLRKWGVNMVRQHTVQDALGPLDAKGRLDPARLRAFDEWFAILKDEGIYSTWSLFYPHLISPKDGYALAEELEAGPAGTRRCTGFATIWEALQESEWRWAKALLTHRNPFTKTRYCDEPALAVIEVRNEDSIFWHFPLNPLAEGKRFPKHSADLRAGWRAWLERRYGADEALLEAWGAGADPKDSLRSESLRLYAAWQLSAPKPAEARRAGDFIRYLAERQRAGYERRIARLRELGFRGPVVTTAWRAGGAAADPANTWCDAAGDMISRHNYFGGGEGGHDIKPGAIDNRSHMDRPGRGLLSMGLYQVEDRAFCTTEWTQKPPNEFKLEAAPLIAFYGMGLQGWDASMHFAQERASFGNGWPGNRSYVTETPHVLGQFPALRRAIAGAHIAEAPIVLGRRRAIDALFEGRDCLDQDLSGGGYDDKDLAGGATRPEWLLVGRVTTRFEAGEDISGRLEEHMEDGVIRSVTKELEWHTDPGRVLVKSPKTQAVIGRVGGATVRLPAVTIRFDTPFVSLILTPLDEEPLARSARILVTALARDRQRGSRVSEDRSRLLELGGGLLELEPVQATLRFEGAPPKAVQILDGEGVPTGREVAIGDEGEVRIDGRAQAWLYLVTR